MVLPNEVFQRIIHALSYQRSQIRSWLRSGQRLGGLARWPALSTGTELALKQVELLFNNHAAAVIKRLKLDSEKYYVVLKRIIKHPQTNYVWPGKVMLPFLLHTTLQVLTSLGYLIKTYSTPHSLTCIIMIAH